ncbi:hypothetical protein QJS10_CPA09g00225 [Acorus calamus]|uniref:Uncharacterized protein n=1 Tax=Acorus calamus TaxID=4465 RepID=A0AAV9E4N1_ACOCL|nr:hypothetical protein QJS10_CPA09g00225 [Acorus calamus]
MSVMFAEHCIPKKSDEIRKCWMRGRPTNNQMDLLAGYDIKSSAEMSGQNFKQKDSEDCAGGEELSFSKRKRRLKVATSANAYSMDQVVPHGRRPKETSSRDNDSVKKNHRV